MSLREKVRLSHTKGSALLFATALSIDVWQSVPFRVNKKVQAQSSLIIAQQLLKLETRCCTALKSQDGRNCIRYTQIPDLIEAGNHKRFLGCV